MASPQQPHPIECPAPDDHEAPRFRVRVAGWDLVGTLATLTALVVVATTTKLPSRLFGFLADVCAEDSCTTAPFGINYYIYPVVWGGVGAACAAVLIGPFVSLVKGWYMIFWPVLAVVLVMLSSLLGSVLTAFSATYSH